MPGVNHLGCEVKDVDGLRDRLKSAGYKESTPPNEHPYRKRVYFYDPEGNDTVPASVGAGESCALTLSSSLLPQVRCYN